MTSSYAGVYHDREAPIDVTNHGVLFLNSAVRYEEIGDGAAQTMFVGEHLVQVGDLGWASGTKATLRNVGDPFNKVKTSPLPLPILPAGPGATFEEEEAAAKTTASAAKKGAPKAEEKKAADPVGGFSSSHPGGVNMAFGDGSVKFVKSTCSPRILSLLANRNDGEMLSADHY
jgi:prepilin-type processing-associated H-X9-DG protein